MTMNKLDVVQRQERNNTMRHVVGGRNTFPKTNPDPEEVGGGRGYSLCCSFFF